MSKGEASHGVWSAPAKLNLMLHVVGRRQDGYHELQTVFQLIDLCDRIDITVRMDGVITRLAGPPGVPEDDDLAIRAARTLQQVMAPRWEPKSRLIRGSPWAGAWAVAARMRQPPWWP